MNLPTSIALLAGPPRAVANAPGANPAATDDGPAFAQALDAAEAGQRNTAPAAADRDEGGPAADAPAYGAERRALPRPGAPRASDSVRVTAAAADFATGPSTSSRPAVDAASEEPMAATDTAPATPGAMVAADAPPAEMLAALFSSLPLPPPMAPPANAGARGAAGDAPRTDTGLALQRQLGQGDTIAATRPVNAGAEPPQPTPPDPSATALPPGLQALARSPGRWAAATDAATGSGQESVPHVAVQRAAGQPADAPAALPATAAPWTVVTPAAPTAPPLQQAEVSPPVGSREFAPALAGQLSVMVRDGIERAQLKLNPAELGPIEVRISIDGTQAQVDFSAAHAATRLALQEAVPTLAGTLRENGLTLTGGGVFEQPRDARGESRPDTPRSQPSFGGLVRDARDAGTAPARPVRARGMLDLYA